MMTIAVNRARQKGGNLQAAWTVTTMMEGGSGAVNAAAARRGPTIDGIGMVTERHSGSTIDVERTIHVARTIEGRRNESATTTAGKEDTSTIAVAIVRLRGSAGETRTRIDGGSAAEVESHRGIDEGSAVETDVPRRENDKKGVV